MRLLVIGDGRMGRAIAEVARAGGDDVVAVLGPADNIDGGGIAAFVGRVDAAIEFTEPAAAHRNLVACLAAGIPVVCGTTGWDAQRPTVEELARERRGALLIAPNFSIGVALLLELAARAGALFAQHPQFGAALVETHHAAKKDAPSGTAIAIHDALVPPLGREVPMTSVRVGAVPGTHTIVFDGPFEQVTLTHEARDRRVFADGAVRAAHWLAGRQGVFSMRDVLANDP